MLVKHRRLARHLRRYTHAFTGYRNFIRKVDTSRRRSCLTKECWKVRMIFITKPDECSKERIWPKRTHSMICRRQIHFGREQVCATQLAFREDGWVIEKQRFFHYEWVRHSCGCLICKLPGFCQKIPRIIDHIAWMKNFMYDKISFVRGNFLKRKNKITKQGIKVALCMPTLGGNNE